MAKRKIPADAKRKRRTKTNKITEDTPLTPIEQSFLAEYVKTGLTGDSLKKVDPTKRSSTYSYSTAARKILAKPNVEKELKLIMDEIRKEAIANADEVMSYLTRVMRGEEKDQFGLEAPLAERTKAALEIAKRTIDIDNKVKLQQSEQPKPIEITLNWSRPDVDTQEIDGIT